MRTIALTALLTTGFALPALAADRKPHERTYLALYAQLRDRHGVRAPGCNLVTDRYGNRCYGRTTRARIRKSSRTLRRMLYVPPARVAPVPLAEAVPAPTGPSSGGSVPSTSGPEQFAGCESGGDWNATNPSSGAYGRYQIMPSTHADICPDLGWDPSSQTACANRVYQEQGSGAWAQCGG